MNTINPESVDWNNWQIKVVTEPTPFPPHLPVKRVSINSFGYGGTNGHLIVEGVSSFLPNYKLGEAKSKPRGTRNRNRPFLLPFSAHDRTTLNRNIAAYADVITQHNLHDLSYTLSCRRTHLQSRGFIVVSDGSLQDTFKASGEGFSFANTKVPPKIGFAFTGQVRLSQSLLDIMRPATMFPLPLFPAFSSITCSDFLTSSPVRELNGLVWAVN